MQGLEWWLVEPSLLECSVGLVGSGVGGTGGRGVGGWKMNC